MYLFATSLTSSKHFVYQDSEYVLNQKWQVHTLREEWKIESALNMFNLSVDFQNILCL